MPLDLDAMAEVDVGMVPSDRHGFVHEFVQLRRVRRVPQGSSGRMHRRTSRCSLRTNSRKASSFHSRASTEGSSGSGAPAGSSATTLRIRNGRADQYQARAAPARSGSGPVVRTSSSAVRRRRRPKAFSAGSTKPRLKLGFGSRTAACDEHVEGPRGKDHAPTAQLAQRFPNPLHLRVATRRGYRVDIQPVTPDPAHTALMRDDTAPCPVLPSGGPAATVPST